MLIDHYIHDDSWKKILGPEFEKPYLLELLEFIKQERQIKNVFPEDNQLFQAFNTTPYTKVKVVIVGQDPYHGKGQANGLAFSVQEECKLPPSLKNIYKEMVDDVNIPMPTTGLLLPLAHQGVLLLNSTLTVVEKEPQSHYGKGWERFTNFVIMKLIEKKEPIVFMLWGKSAQEKCNHFLTDDKEQRHLVLKAAHPSPYSAYNGFFGCKHFSKANHFLQEHAILPIDWHI